VSVVVEIRGDGVGAEEAALDGVYAFGEGGVGDGDEGIVAENAARGIETAPAGAGEIHFGPGVHGGREGIEDAGRGRLVEVTADEAGGEAEGAAERDEEDGVVAARAAAIRERFGGRLDAGFIAARVGERLADGGVELGEEGDGVGGWGREILGEPVAELRLRVGAPR
jgi:hypothetical protein